MPAARVRIQTPPRRNVGAQADLYFLHYYVSDSPQLT